MQLNNFKFGLIGNGDVVQKHHLPAISRLGGKVLEITDEKKDYHDVLNNKEIDVVVVASPNYLHVPMALDALDSGKKVILEKPVGINVQDAQRLLNHPKSNEIAVCYQRRFNSQCQAIKDYAMTHPIVSIDAMVLVHRDPPYWNTWRSDIQKSGGGNLINIDIHYLDLLLWWTTGRATVRSVDIEYLPNSVIDISVLTNGFIGKTQWWFRGSANHDKRVIWIEVTFADGTQLRYDTDDASHFDVYEQFLYYNNFISVQEAMKSLDLVERIYATSQN